MPERMLRRPPPILVTGVPRSGTTWLARWLARGGGMALTGREPMNPEATSTDLRGPSTGGCGSPSLDNDRFVPCGGPTGGCLRGPTAATAHGVGQRHSRGRVWW